MSDSQHYHLNHAKMMEISLFFRLLITNILLWVLQKINKLHVSEKIIYGIYDFIFHVVEIMVEKLLFECVM